MNRILVLTATALIAAMAVTGCTASSTSKPAPAPSFPSSTTGAMKIATASNPDIVFDSLKADDYAVIRTESGDTTDDLYAWLSTPGCSKQRVKLQMMDVITDVVFRPYFPNAKDVYPLAADMAAFCAANPQ